jgi:hypothetical protein
MSLAARTPSLVVLGPAEAALEPVFSTHSTGHHSPDEALNPLIRGAVEKTAESLANGISDGADNRTVGAGADGPRVIANVELAEVAALARLARGFVGNDSGVSHLAAAAGAPGLAIFGPTDPARWRPLGRTTVIRREPLSALTMQEVEAALLEIIGTG